MSKSLDSILTQQNRRTLARLAVLACSGPLSVNVLESHQGLAFVEVADSCRTLARAGGYTPQEAAECAISRAAVAAMASLGRKAS